ncbi:hypothetical protein PLESTB_000855400 [Pleodorina starrii]|uniref:Peptidase M11 gametolysin domain-containing protein n=1 Tax=Pleodorina starrii TaxID=330485 RepID=A0A9W6F325_9CHLO|nr:hypothetical protein PLESTB_000855400 [Pleodorina starrii]GLC72009.1 hypothetical protein PLESTF_001194600 [Pleodorina starrii]
MGLQHAAAMQGQWYEEYGDKSDPMGDTDAAPKNAPQCHNPASNWKINWAGPVPGGYLTHASFTPRSNRLTFTIPASSLSDQNMVVVDLGIVTRNGTKYPRLRKYFLGYRVRNTTYGGYDSGLNNWFNQKVTVHAFDANAIDDDVMFWVNTIYHSAGPRFGVAQGGHPIFPDVWTSPFVPVDAATGRGGGIRVKVVSRDAVEAVVEVCRMYSETEGAPASPECRDNFDRDW